MLQDLIYQIPGIHFIWVFILYALVVLFIFRWFTNTQIAKKEVDIIESLTPFHLAYLKGGTISLVQTIVFVLFQKKMLSLSSAKIEQIPDADPSGLDLLETIVFNSANEVKTSDRLLVKFTSAFASLRPDFELPLIESGLLRDSSQQSIATRLSIAAAICIYSIGFLRLYMGITNDRPVLFLILTLVLVTVLLFVIMKPFAKFTPGGKNFVKEFLKKDVLNNPEEFWFADTQHYTDKLTWSVALLGMPALAGTEYYSDFSFFRMNTSSSGSSWLGSYDGGSSSCGGGGGGGGGGCGGCGSS